MEEPVCCGRAMYQELGHDNILSSVCKVCGKTLRKKIKLCGTAKDNIEYYTLGVENFNIKGEGKEELL